jgi:hypothetical protein
VIQYVTSVGAHIARASLTHVGVRITLSLKHFQGGSPMSTYLRPTELAKYLDVAPQKISQLRARGIITPEQDGSYEADATRVAYIRNLRAHVVPAASASLTEERALLLRARRARMELETARMRGGTITPEEDERRLDDTIPPGGHPGRLFQRHR